jgi:hypothetical protein
MTVNRSFRMIKFRVVLLGAATIFYGQASLAGPREQAKRMFDRLTGVPPSQETLSQMEDLILSGNAEKAALAAMESPFFYNLGLKNWISSWTNVDGNARVPLNDFTATVIGAIRDDVPFDRLLYDDILYVGPTSATVAAYSPLNNTHYHQLETTRVDLKAGLQKVAQSSLNGLSQTAGVMTTRAFGEAYYNMGTNRRAVRFTLTNFLCNDLEQLADTTRPDFRIRRDVDRSPGGDSLAFRNKCAGCHTGMDALAGAFAYFDFTNGQIVRSNNVVGKYSINSEIFPDGFVTTNDSWMNLWIGGPNKTLGWNGAVAGSGPKEYGQMLASSDAFPKCMAKRVFQKVCLRAPASAQEETAVAEFSQGFAKDGNFNMRNLFAKTAAFCMGD